MCEKWRKFFTDFFTEKLEMLNQCNSLEFNRSLLLPWLVLDIHWNRNNSRSVWLNVQAVLGRHPRIDAHTHMIRCSWLPRYTPLKHTRNQISFLGPSGISVIYMFRGTDYRPRLLLGTGTALDRSGMFVHVCSRLLPLEACSTMS